MAGGRVQRDENGMEISRGLVDAVPSVVVCATAIAYPVDHTNVSLLAPKVMASGQPSTKKSPEPNRADGLTDERSPTDLRRRRKRRAVLVQSLGNTEVG